MLVLDALRSVTQPFSPAVLTFGFTKYGNADLRTPVNARPSVSILQDIKVYLGTLKVGQ